MSDTYVFGVPLAAMLIGALAQMPELSAAGIGAFIWTIALAVQGRFIFQNQLRDGKR